jgi:tRNA(fMet)-specific endonuclease VapC
VKYVLDTNAVSALMKGDENLVRRLARISRADVSVPQPVMAEIAYGLERLPPSKRRESLQARFELVLGELRRAVWSDEVSLAFGVIKAWLERRGQRIEDFDAAVAAHALALGSVLITANMKHMRRIPRLEIQDWSKTTESR